MMRRMPRGHAIGLTIVMFMLIYNISFRAAPSVSTGRVAVLVLIMALGRRVLPAIFRFASANWAAVLLMGAVTAYALVQFLFGGLQDTDQLSRLLHFAVLSVFGCLAF